MEHLGDQMKRAVRIAIKSALYSTEVKTRKFGRYLISVTPRPQRRCLWNVSTGGQTVAYGVWQEKEKATEKGVEL